MGGLLDRIQHLVPAPDGGDYFVWIGLQLEGPRLGVVFGEETVDRHLEVDDRAEDAAFQPALGQRGEEPLHGVQPRARGRREVERPARVPVEPLPNFRMLVRGVIVEDGVNDFAGWNLGLDGVEEPDELLMPVALHVATDYRAVEHIVLVGCDELYWSLASRGCLACSRRRPVALIAAISRGSEEPLFRPS